MNVLNNYIRVNSETGGYNVYIQNCFSDLASAFANSDLSGRDVFIVTDRNVKELYLDSFLTAASDVVSVKGIYIISPGEGIKNLDTVSEIYKIFSDAKVDRRTVAVALGGGVAGDICGFAAATFMRGIPFVQVPTTLMSMVDSSVGGKTGVNFEGIKNLVGSFYAPEFVYINTDTLKTLPQEQFSAGMAEVVKHGLIHDKDYFNFLDDSKNKIAAYNDDNTPFINRLIHRSIEIKSEIVSSDEKEKGIREILNFGHTFGHSIESLLEYKMPHGFCVGIGMSMALTLSASKGYIKFNVVEKYKNLCCALGIPTKLSDIGTELNSNDIYTKMLQDKKTRDGKIRLILLKQVGKAFVSELCEKDEIIESIETI